MVPCPRDEVLPWMVHLEALAVAVGVVGTAEVDQWVDTEEEEEIEGVLLPMTDVGNVEVVDVTVDATEATAMIGEEEEDGMTREDGGQIEGGSTMAAQAGTGEGVNIFKDHGISGFTSKVVL